MAISNFNNSNVAQIATVDSIGNIKITPAAGTYGVSATGVFNNNTITISFTTYVTGGAGYKCDMTLIKE